MDEYENNDSNLNGKNNNHNDNDNHTEKLEKLLHENRKKYSYTDNYVDKNSLKYKIN